MRIQSINIRNLVLGLCVLFTLSGCVKNKVLVKVDEDGSGHIMVSRIFQKEMVDMVTQQMETMATQMPANTDMPEDPFYDEKQMKAEAKQFGPGVEFLRAKKYERNGAKGYVALYKFDNINSLFFNLDDSQGMESMGSAMSGGMGETGVAEKGENAISFELEEGETPKLHVRVPDYPAPSEDLAEGDEDAAQKPAYEGQEGEMAMQQMESMENPFGFTGKETRGEALKKMMSGMSSSLLLEVSAQEQESDAAHIRENAKGKTQYVLLDMNMEEILSDDDALRMMCDDGMQNMAGMGPGSDGLEFYSNMNGIKGMTVQTKDFVVTFK